MTQRDLKGSTSDWAGAIGKKKIRGKKKRGKFVICKKKINKRSFI